MTLDDELRANYYLCAEVIRSRRRTGQPIPEWMRRHFNQLEAQFKGMSPTRHPVVGNGDCAPQSQHGDIIGTREVAEMLKLTPRQVQLRANQLGGVRVCGRLLFMRAEIAEWARGGC
ncbi:MAG TPA: helix-turn-helix domain-containing protein [Mycobacterium sp.]|jgi:hypothetical protein|nr:helix-turn-helix domain-containing protein [Mycobacterium sp.]